MQEAHRRSEEFTISHLIETAVRCLSVGGKDTFSEGQEPHLQKKKEGLIEKIADYALRRDWLLQLMENPVAQATEAARQQRFAEVTEALFNKPDEGVSRLQSMLDDHREELAADTVPDREVRQAMFTTFLDRVSRLSRGSNLGPSGAEMSRALSYISSRPDAAILEGDAFIVRADRSFLNSLKNSQCLTSLGAALTGLLIDENGAARLLILSEEVRLACLRRPHASQFYAELLRTAQRHLIFRGRVDEIAEVVEDAFTVPPDAGMAQVIAGWFAKFSPTSVLETGAMLMFLFGSVKRAVGEKYVSRIEQLLELLKENK
jgi:hypothetical protein